MVMRIQYQADTALPAQLVIYASDNDSVTFHDDGIAPDAAAGDYKYAAYLKDDINLFKSSISAKMALLSQKGNYLKWTGHSGEMISDISVIDWSRFDQNLEIEMPIDFLYGSDCSDVSIKKENSLFITDLAVVENGARTYNVYTGTGTPTGAWTFGHLMEQAANEAETGISAAVFMREWVKQWTQDQTVNGQIVPKRVDVIVHLIGPWLKKATGNSSLTVTESNWEGIWNGANEQAIVQNAPFKLTAIVNRLDVRENTSYNTFLRNAGETRFIFSLINPYNGQVNMHINNDFENQNFYDWEGMNVIFEYGNVAATRCQLQVYAQQWLTLSSMALGTEPYNAALQIITNQVTAASAKPTGPNKSALLRVRTNERLFVNDYSQHGNNIMWSGFDWQLRQFEIDPASHLLKMAPVTNTPVASANYALNIGGFTTGTALFDILKGKDLVNWAFKPSVKNRLLAGNHNMPASMLAAVADVSYDFVTYWDFPWLEDGAAGPYYDPYAIGAGDYPQYKQMRQQLSLNTCQGCHSGENKVEFTQLHPRGYGQPAVYWGTAPTYENRLFDVRFQFNSGITTLPSATLPDNYYKNGAATQRRQIVSAFLTGRLMSGNYSTSSWQDDLNTSVDNGKDPFIDNSLYYVSDPSNNTYYTSPNPQMRWGYNDLERRKNDMCSFLSSCCNCTFSIGEAVIKNVFFVPLPVASH